MKPGSLDLIILLISLMFFSCNEIQPPLLITGGKTSQMDSKPQSSSQNWNGKKCAVVLTYDDALNVHLDNAIPLLDSLGLKGTFYISANSSGFKERTNDWKEAANNGHELGNHTLFHPCYGNLEGREWVNPAYDLSTYSLQRIVDEIRLTNVLLNSIDGKNQRTFAYTCGEMKVGEEHFIVELEDDLVAARAVKGELEQLGEIDLYKINSFPIVGESGDELVSLVKEAIQTNSLIVFLFHGVGGEHFMDVSLQAHRQLLQFLKENENDIWTATMLDVAINIKENKAKIKE